MNFDDSYRNGDVVTSEGKIFLENFFRVFGIALLICQNAALGPPGKAFLGVEIWNPCQVHVILHSKFRKLGCCGRDGEDNIYIECAICATILIDFIKKVCLNLIAGNHQSNPSIIKKDAD
jgi:hypothetical protein